MHLDYLSATLPRARRRYRALAGLVLFILIPTGTAAHASEAMAVDFSRDIRPILADNCFNCHGPGEGDRQAGLRLDISTGPFQQLESGEAAVIPGNSGQSELFRRLVSRDNGQRMPPPESHKSLSPHEIDLIRRWIDEGAKWETHWAYRPIERPQLPRIAATEWPSNPIDFFTLAVMEREGLQPSPMEGKERWLRRVTFDLTGLPPTVKELDDFLNATSPGAIERAVDRLLHSPRYGERMAVHWLDLARYADTNGYHIDNAREMWRWRDWVIDAFNHNMPFDRFTLEQLAGDLLPNPTLDQLIATGFNRNHMINFENGIFDEEYRAEYVADRVITTSTVWLGQTMQCARCHDHKYDPLSTRDFYQLFAFFNNVPENGVDGKQGNAPPLVTAPTRLQRRRLERLADEINKTSSQMKRLAAQSKTGQAKWETALLAGKQKLWDARTDVLVQYAFDETDGGVAHDSGAGLHHGKVVGQPIWVPRQVGGVLLFTGDVYVDAGEAAKLKIDEPFTLSAWLYPTTPDEMTILAKSDDQRSGYELAVVKRRLTLRLVGQWPDLAIVVVSKTPLNQSKWQHVTITYDGSGKASGVEIYLDGKETEAAVESDSLSGDFARDTDLLIGRRTENTGFRGMIDDLRVYGRALAGTEVAILAGGDPILATVRTPRERRTKQQQQMLTTYYLENHDSRYAALKTTREQFVRQRAALERELPTVMIMQEMRQPRATHILERGDYRYLGERVDPGTPSCLPPVPNGSSPDRLALARWLISPDNPLTARVVVNRLWQLHFGVGLVKTSEDFGTRGEFPSHPTLLDWLASEFIRSSWDVKHIQRLIVTSATYRQSSRSTPDQLRRDPENRSLTRGPRKALAAEFVRDQALAVSGLLVERLGGPSVFPYQPAGLWREVSYSPGEYTAQEFVQDRGEKLYRRGIYTFWKRSVPPPSLEAFGAPDREVCTVRRQPSNTPFHSLVLLNDPAYVEAARLLAERIFREETEDRDRIKFGFRAVTSRIPTDVEVEVLLRVLSNQRSKYRGDMQSADQLLQVGEYPADASLDSAELASWTIVAATLINMHEALRN